MGGWAGDGGGPGALPGFIGSPAPPAGHGPHSTRRRPALRTCGRSPPRRGGGRWGGGGTFGCLGSGGVSGSSLPEGTTRDVPRPEISPLRITEGWGGDVLNFYWLLMLCVFWASWGKEPGKCHRLKKSFTSLSEAFKLALVCLGKPEGDSEPTVVPGGGLQGKVFSCLSFISR